MTQETTTLDWETGGSYVPDVFCFYCGKEFHLSTNTYVWFDGPIRCERCLCLFRVRIGDIYPAWERMSPTNSQTRRVMRATTWPVPGVNLSGGKLLEATSAFDSKNLVSLEAIRLIDDLNVPETVREALKSAQSCYATEAYNAVCMMCRFAIEGALISHGITGRSPMAMVKDAEIKGLIGGLVVRECETAVFIGGKAAHPQEDAAMQVGREDALVAFSLVSKLVKELFGSNG